MTICLPMNGAVKSSRRGLEDLLVSMTPNLIMCGRRRTPRFLAIGALIGARGHTHYLPQLARVKAAAQMARLRTMWDLQNGRTTDARDDLLAAFTMGRNGSRDNSLIAVLVQIAAENIIASTVAENFGRFSPETLNELVDGFDAAPARGTVANSIATTEMHAFADWAETRVLELRK